MRDLSLPQNMLFIRNGIKKSLAAQFFHLHARLVVGLLMMKGELIVQQGVTKHAENTPLLKLDELSKILDNSRINAGGVYGFKIPRKSVPCDA